MESIQKLGKKEQEHKYSPPENGFAGDCIYATQKHFVEKLLDGREFETNGRDYLKSLEIREAVYLSAVTDMPVPTTNRGRSVKK